MLSSIQTNIPILTPYNGKDYSAKAAVVEAFRSGKDFIFNDMSSQWDGKPCSIRDFKVGDQVKLRYNKLRSVTYYQITEHSKLN
jgi:hypothetical protein